MMREHLERSPPTNTSTHAPYWRMYDAATRDLVRERDAPIIERFRYRFEPDDTAM